MKIRDFLPVLILAAAIMALPAFAQEDVTPVEEVPEEEIIIEEEPVEEPAEEEIIIEEEPVEEEAVEEPAEEEFIIEEEPAEEEVVEEPEEEIVEEEVSSFKPGWVAKAYVNFGPIEPWGSPGTGSHFGMGMRIQGGAQLNIGNWIDLPLIFEPLTAEVMVGYGMWNIKSDVTDAIYQDASTNVISLLALGRYDVTDLIMKAIGFEYPALGIFGVAGLQYNMQSWDFPNWTTGGEVRKFDSASQFGLNLGLGVKYNLQSLVGKPVEVDLRFTQGIFIMGDVKDQDGNSMFGDKYNHSENGLLLGIAYPF